MLVPWLQSGAGSKVALGHNAHLHITYSAGLQALQLGKFSTALRCFQVRRILKHFRNVETRLYCPQTFLSVNFHCGDDVFEIKQAFGD